MADLLLIHPTEKGLDTGKYAHGQMPPLGLLWIASFVEREGFSVDVMDYQIGAPDIEDYITLEKPKAVGIGGTSHTRFGAFEMARRVKGADPRITVIYGGPHATFTAQDTLSNIPEIDIIVRGEGEATVLELVGAYVHGDGDRDRVDIRGISYRDEDGRIVDNPDRPRIIDLDSIPIPARDKVDMSRYSMKMDYLNVPGTSIMTSRGCPVNCSFCSASAMFGRNLTLRSAPGVLDEVEDLLNGGCRGIKFFDSTLTLRKDHARSICEEFKKRGLADVPWECEVRVNTVTRELLYEMREAGCYMIDFGVESASPRVLKDMGKGITVEQVEMTLEWAREAGLKTKVFFTYGHINETLSDALVTFDFIKEHRDKIDQTGGGVGIKIYPGTQVERFALENNLLPADFSWSAPYSDPETDFFWGHTHIPMLVQPCMGLDDLRRLRYRLIRPKLLNPRTLAAAVIKTVRAGNWKKIWHTIKGIYRTLLSNAGY